jgi:hypothetical protein
MLGLPQAEQGEAKMVDPIQRPNPAPMGSQVRQDQAGPSFSLPEFSDALVPSLTPYPMAALEHLLGLQEGQCGFHQDGDIARHSLGLGQAPLAGAGSEGVSTGQETTEADLSRFVGRSVGSGQCVALVRAANPDLGSTHGWTGGSPVQGNTAIKPGTAIATFDSSNRYANKMDGSSHAAIYLGQDERGIQVVDQWAGSTAGVRTIAWGSPGATAANTGAAFKVVETTRA